MDKDNSGYLDENELLDVMTKIAADIGLDKPTKEEVH